MLPGETACFACAPPLVIAIDGDEMAIKREGVCTASLPTTMGIIAGFLSQNVLKYLLKFGTVSQFLGYNALEDFFPKYPLTPNPECTDKYCLQRQKFYNDNMEKRRFGKEEVKPKEDTHKEVTHDENEWGISLEADTVENTTPQEQKKPDFVEVKKEYSLAELMASMKKL